jgi:hypothetical protein
MASNSFRWRDSLIDTLRWRKAAQHPAAASIELTSDPFRPLNRVHALGFLAAPIESTRLVERGLGRRQVLGSWPSGTFRLLHRCRAASGLALHVLRRSSASLRRLVHGHGWRMLLTCGVSRSRRWAAALSRLAHGRRRGMLRAG